jgi:alkylhydroperoxidase/carboxymuconolactone decarboxylase family protein YurZ
MATRQAGPLDEPTHRLVKPGIAIGALAEGAVRSNTRKALDLGISEDQLRHVVVLAITTSGFPTATPASAGSKRSCAFTGKRPRTGQDRRMYLHLGTRRDDPPRG